MFIDPALENKQLGQLGELLVQFRLLCWNVDVTPAGDNKPYDLIAFINKPFRIQVKSSTTKKEYSYKFSTSRGLNKRIYTGNDMDILALVALDIGRIFFSPPISTKSTNVRKKDFNTLTERQSWDDIVSKLK